MNFARVIALSLNTAAFVAEVVRGGVGSIEKGQTAAKAIGMRRSQILVFILLPQPTGNGASAHERADQPGQKLFAPIRFRSMS